MFEVFTTEALESLVVHGIAARWSAVQERLHSVLLALAAQLEAAGQAQFGREWPLYEVSWKTAR